MGTASTIGIKRKDGSVTAIRCHFDGYIDYTGVLLYGAYQNIDKIEELVSMGEM